MTQPDSPDARADAFLEIADQFRLGELDTESPHPLTRDLARDACHDLPRALDTFHVVDKEALAQLVRYAPGITAMAHDIRATLTAGHRVYLCGCGATGRLALSLEVLVREGLLPQPWQDRVRGFMAGGDCALVRSIENFEDHPEFGARMLHEAGFTADDLLLAITEGGETPYVIGACEEAARTATRKPWFLYCNPDAPLRQAATRSAKVLDNPAIQKLNLSVGPMALSGSTRLQATTVQMAAVGFALQCIQNPDTVAPTLDAFRRWHESQSYRPLQTLTETESEAYEQNGSVLYETDAFGITVLTDTTERAPTFSLVPFENELSPNDPLSLCYLTLPPTATADDAWRTLLQRTPRTLDWPDYARVASLETMRGFDLSLQGKTKRQQRTATGFTHTFRIHQQGDQLHLQCDTQQAQWNISQQSLLARHLLLKMLLNAHSTLVMGRLGRYESNLMTWVKPSNHKLIDRCARYALILLQQRGQTNVDYANIVRTLFTLTPTLKPGEPIVLKTVEALSPSS